MPRNPANRPLRRVTLNLYDADCDELSRLYGVGWTGKVRELVEAHLQRKVTVEDYLKHIGADLG